MSDDQTHPAALSTLTMAMLGGLVLVLVSGFLALVLTNHDVTTYVLFVAGPLVTTVTAALIGQRVKAVEEVARTVEAQTNGLLSASIADLHEHLDEQTQELLPATPAPGPTSSSRLPPPPREKPHEIVDLPVQDITGRRPR